MITFMVRNENMQLNENIILAKRLNKVSMKEYNGITTLNAREVVDTFNSDPAIKKTLDKLAE